MKEVDAIEIDQNKNLRTLINKVIDGEVECKKVIADVQRI